MNQSIIFMATVGPNNLPTNLPNIGARDGSNFICEATFDGVPTLAAEEISIAVKSKCDFELIVPWAVISIV